MNPKSELFKEPKFKFEVRGKLTKIVDGDTYEMDAQGDTYILRVWNLDTPEKGQQMGEQITEYLNNHILGREVTFKFLEKGEYGRNIGKVLIHDPNFGKVDIALHLIKQGFGYATSKNINDIYHQEMLIASGNKKGVWGLEQRIHPQDYRAGLRAMEKKPEDDESNSLRNYLGMKNRENDNFKQMNNKQQTRNHNKGKRKKNNKKSLFD